MIQFTDGQIKEILACKASGMKYVKIANKMQKQYGVETNPDQIRYICRKYKHLLEVGDVVADIKILKENARVKRNNSHKAKENKTILEALNNQEDLLSCLKRLVKDINFPVLPKPVKRKKDKGKKGMTLELMLTDLHIGKKTDTFDLEVARQRLRDYIAVVHDEIDRYSYFYNMDEIVVFLGGDIIENSIMHGPESVVGCEFQNPEQVRWCIELLYTEVLLPLIASGIPLHIVCITGNHDRQEQNKTFHLPGKNSLSWVVYQTLKMLVGRLNMSRITWDIPESIYTTYSIYQDNVLYEHGDHIKGRTKEVYAKHMSARSVQVGKIISGIRLGHWHEYLCFDNGKAIVNSSLCGQDSYSETKGYDSKPGQVINYYVDTENRSSAFYHSFLVQL